MHYLTQRVEEFVVTNMLRYLILQTADRQLESSGQDVNLKMNTLSCTICEKLFIFTTHEHLKHEYNLHNSHTRRLNSGQCCCEKHCLYNFT